MIVTPGLATDAVHDTAIDPLPGTTVTPVGVYGRNSGVTATDGDDATLEPTTFDAVTVNVYAVPFVSADTVHDNVTDVHVFPPGDDVTV